MTRKTWLFCGILSSVVYAAASVVGALVWKDYSLVSQSVSELSAIGAPSRPVVITLGFGYDILVMAFGLGLWRSTDRKILRVVGALFVGFGAFCLTGPFTPMHLRGAERSLTDTLHIISTAVDVGFILLIVGVTAAAFDTWFRFYSIATIAVMLIFGALTSLDGPRLAANLPTPWMGVMERIDIGSFLVWVVVLAVTLWRRGDGIPLHEREPGVQILNPGKNAIHHF